MQLNTKTRKNRTKMSILVEHIIVLEHNLHAINVFRGMIVPRIPLSILQTLLDAVQPALSIKWNQELNI